MVSTHSRPLSTRVGCFSYVRLFRVEVNLSAVNISVLILNYYFKEVTSCKFSRIY